MPLPLSAYESLDRDFLLDNILITTAVDILLHILLNGHWCFVRVLTPYAILCYQCLPLVSDLLQLHKVNGSKEDAPLTSKDNISPYTGINVSVLSCRMQGGITCRGKPEEGLLAAAVLSIVQWLLTCMQHALKNLQELRNGGIELASMMDKPAVILAEMLKCDFLVAMLCLAKHECRGMLLHVGAGGQGLYCSREVRLTCSLQENSIVNFFVINISEKRVF